MSIAYGAEIARRESVIPTTLGSDADSTVIAGGWLIALSSFYTKIGNLAGGIPMEEKFAGGGDRPMQRRYWVNGGEKIRPLGSLVHTVLGPRVVNMPLRFWSKISP